MAEEITPAKDTRPAKGRGGKYNFPNATPPQDPEIVKAVIATCAYWYRIGKVQAQDDDEIDQRTDRFIERCLETGEIPTWEKYCLCLGYPRNTVWEWKEYCKQGERRANIIKKAKEFIAAYDADMLIAGKMNPVAYIFRAKNYDGMTDQQNIVVTPDNRLAQSEDVTAIAARYEELPE